MPSKSCAAALLRSCLAVFFLVGMVMPGAEAKDCTSLLYKSRCTPDECKRQCDQKVRNHGAVCLAAATVNRGVPDYDCYCIIDCAPARAREN